MGNNITLNWHRHNFVKAHLVYLHSRRCINGCNLKTQATIANIIFQIGRGSKRILSSICTSIPWCYNYSAPYHSLSLLLFVELLFYSNLSALAKTECSKASRCILLEEMKGVDSHTPSISPQIKASCANLLKTCSQTSVLF